MSRPKGRKTLKGIVNCAYKLLSDKKNWAQGSTGMDANGTPVDANDPAAVKWCLAGAFYVCSATSDPNNTDYTEDHYKAMELVDSICRDKFGVGMTSVNDNMGYDAVMEVLTIAHEKVNA